MKNKYWMTAIALGLVGVSSAGAQDTLGTDRSCPTPEQIEKKAQIYRNLVRDFWVKDSLFMYAEVAKVVSAQVNTALNGSLRKKIADFKSGKGGVTADEIESALKDVIENTSAYADSLVNNFQHPFYWHNPIIKVKSSEPRQVIVTVPTTLPSYSLSIELGQDAAAEATQLQAGVKSIIGERVGRALVTGNKQLPKSFLSEKDYLMRQESIPESCLAFTDASRTSQLRQPANNGMPATSRVSSRGRREGAPVLGFATGHVRGKSPPSVVDSPYNTWSGGSTYYDPYSSGFGVQGGGLYYSPYSGAEGAF